MAAVGIRDEYHRRIKQEGKACGLKVHDALDMYLGLALSKYKLKKEFKNNTIIVELEEIEAKK